jgi:hypothetical protein
VHNFAAIFLEVAQASRRPKLVGGQNFWGQDDKGKGNLQDFEAG